MKQKPKSNRLKATNTLFEQYLGQAIDEYKIAKSQTRDRAHNKQIELRHSNSCIIYCTSALDSLVNYLRFEMFLNDESDDFILGQERSFALQKILDLWEYRLTVLDKLDLILEQSKSKPLEKNLRQKLKELNNLRNWIVHGKPYFVTYREETTWEGLRFISNIYDVREQFGEDEKFNKTKFNSPTSLNIKDAKTALFMVLETILHVISQRNWFPREILTFYDDGKKHWLSQDATLDSLIRDFDLD
jgi:hypothetical protein